MNEARLSGGTPSPIASGAGDLTVCNAYKQIYDRLKAPTVTICFDITTDLSRYGIPHTDNASVKRPTVTNTDSIAETVNTINTRGSFRFRLIDLALGLAALSVLSSAAALARWMMR